MGALPTSVNQSDVCARLGLKPPGAGAAWHSLAWERASLNRKDQTPLDVCLGTVNIPFVIQINKKDTEYGIHLWAEATVRSVDKSAKLYNRIGQSKNGSLVTSANIIRETSMTVLVIIM